MRLVWVKNTKGNKPWTIETVVCLPTAVSKFDMQFISKSYKWKTLKIARAKKHTKWWEEIICREI